MKTAVVVCVLVLALIAGKKSEAVSEESKEAAKNLLLHDEAACNKNCLDEKVKEATCKEACAINESFKKVWAGALQCSKDCNNAKPCEAGCKTTYEGKVKEFSEGCHAVCTKEEKEQLGLEKCKKICAPSLIYKEMEAAKAKPAP